MSTLPPEDLTLYLHTTFSLLNKHLFLTHFHKLTQIQKYKHQYYIHCLKRQNDSPQECRQEAEKVMPVVSQEMQGKFVKELVECVEEEVVGEMSVRKRERGLVRCREKVRGRWEKEVGKVIERAYEEVKDRKKAGGW